MTQKKTAKTQTDKKPAASQKAATAKTGEKKQPAAQLIVRSRPPRFRRAGREWTREPQTVPVDAFTDEQRAALDNEPNLVVEEVTS